MTLAELQRLVFECVGNGADASLAGALVHGGALSPEARIGIYADMYWLRMHDALQADFPLTQAVLGDENFEILVAKYIRTHPSRHFSLGEAGGALPAYLQAHPVPDAPWLGALAAVERARIEAFIAPDAPVLALSQLAGVPIASARLTASPALRVLTLEYDVIPLWHALQCNQTSPPPQPRRSCIAVWRNQLQALHAEVSPEEAQALQAMLAGSPFPELCACFAALPNAAQVAFTTISEWVNEGMVATIDVTA